MEDEVVPYSVVSRLLPPRRKPQASTTRAARRAKSVISPPNTSMAPPAKKAITPTANATGPESESLTLLSGVSQGRPPPEEAKAGSDRTITARMASVATRRLRVLGDITKLLRVEVGEDVLSSSHALDGHELLDPA